MSANPLGAPKFRAFDANANPLAGGKLYAYEAGTSTPLDTYTTRAGTVANQNPVVLDANGEANVWMAPGVLYKFVLKNASDVTQWTVDNFPSPAISDAATDLVSVTPGGRLTLSSAVPVPTSDVTAATTIYYGTHRHDKVPLYDGASWSLHTLENELSQATADTTKSPAAVAANKVYDLFVWDDDGTLRVSRGPAWTSDTARGTGAGTTQLESLNGRYVNAVNIANGPAIRCGLYVGTVRSDASSQLNDSLAKRHVWNTYNRVERALRVKDATATWAYSSSTWQQANASAANQVDLVRGLDEDAVSLVVAGSVTNSDSTPSRVAVGVGLDSTTTPTSAGSAVASNRCTDAGPIGTMGTYHGLPGLGRHYLAWLEAGASNGDTQTWDSYGTGSSIVGMAGSTLA